MMIRVNSLDLRKVDSKDELAKSFERVFVTVGKKELDIANLTQINSAPSKKEKQHPKY